MIYQQVEATPELAPWIQCFWRWQDKSAGDHMQTIFPDGRCEVIVHLGEPMARCDADGNWDLQPPLLFAAQQRSPVRLRANGPVDCLGIRLQPWASSVLCGDSLPRLRDRIIDLARTAPSLADSLLADARDLHGDWVRHLESVAANTFPGITLDDRIVQTVSRIDASLGQTRLATLATSCAMSPRSLQQRFLEQVGLTLQEYRRIVRLQSAIARLDANPADLAAMALASGFSDQSHATRELSRLTGLTPGRLSRALHTDREGKQTLKLAAAFVRGRTTN